MVIFTISEPPTARYTPARSIFAPYKIEDSTNGKTSNENSTIKKNIVKYNDRIISASSTTIATKRKNYS